VTADGRINEATGGLTPPGRRSARMRREPGYLPMSTPGIYHRGFWRGWWRSRAHRRKRCDTARLATEYPEVSRLRLQGGFSVCGEARRVSKTRVRELGMKHETRNAPHPAAGPEGRMSMRCKRGKV